MEDRIALGSFLQEYEQAVREGEVSQIEKEVFDLLADGMKLAQVADLYGLTEEAVRQRVSRARARIRARFVRRFGAGTAVVGTVVLGLHLFVAVPSGPSAAVDAGAPRALPREVPVNVTPADAEAPIPSAPAPSAPAPSATASAKPSPPSRLDVAKAAAARGEWSRCLRLLRGPIPDGGASEAARLRARCESGLESLPRSFQ